MRAWGYYANLNRTPRMPFCVGIRWEQLAIFLPFISLLWFVLSIGGWGGQSTNNHSFVTWFDTGFLALASVVLIADIFKRVVFTENEIEYHFFWIDRRYRYQDIESVSKCNNDARFLLQSNTSFRVSLTYQDAGYLLKVLEARAPRVLPSLLTVRDKLPGRRPHTSQAKAVP